MDDPDVNALVARINEETIRADAAEVDRDHWRACHADIAETQARLCTERDEALTKLRYLHSAAQDMSMATALGVAGAAKAQAERERDADRTRIENLRARLARVEEAARLVLSGPSRSRNCTWGNLCRQCPLCILRAALDSKGET